MYSKAELDALIREEKRLGTYLFDESNQRFTTDVEIVLGISPLQDGTFQAVYYFFDGYEVTLEAESRLTFDGPEEVAKATAIESWNAKPETFMGFPIFYSNVACELFEEP